MRHPVPGLRQRAALVLVLGGLVLLTAPGSSVASGQPPAPSSGPPPFPSVNVPGELLGFSSNSMEPGATGTLAVTLTDPASDPLNGSLTGATLELQVYRFAYEGSSQNLSAGDTWALGLSLGNGGSSMSVNASFGTVTPGQSSVKDVNVVVPSSASSGSYFVRDRLNFSAGGISYVAASRGFFPEGLWNQATLSCASNGTCTPIFNLTLLGVSGVTPETSIQVTSPWTAVLLGVVLAAAAGFAVAAGYVAFRRRGRPVRDRDGGSSDGAKPSPRRKKAAKALGKSRTKDGD